MILCFMVACSISGVMSGAAPVSEGLYIATSWRAAVTGGGVYHLQHGVATKVIRNEAVEDVSFDLLNRRIFWVNDKQNSIKSSNQDGSDVRLESYISFNGRGFQIDGIYIDSSAQILYYTDSIRGIIVAYNLRTKVRATLLHKTGEAPRDIHVDQQTKKMFWTDWGAFPSVWTARGDGSDAQKLGQSVNWSTPNGLHYDAADMMLYVCDATDGSSTTLVKLNVQSNTVVDTTVYSSTNCIDLTGNTTHLFMSDRFSSTIYAIWKSALSVRLEIYRISNESVAGLQYVEEGFSPSGDPCDDVVCTENRVCVPQTASQYVCLCEILRSEPNCIKEGIETRPAFIVSTASQMYGIVGLPDTYLRTNVHATFYLDTVQPRLFGPALTSDTHLNLFYAFFEGERRIIAGDLNQISLQGSTQIRTIRRDIADVTSMAIDWTVNTLYLTKSAGIYMLNVDTGIIALISDTDMISPTSITVDPENGILYWCDPEMRKIEKMKTDGSSREVLLSVHELVAIAIDYSTVSRGLYFATKERVAFQEEDRPLTTRRIVHLEGKTILDIDFHSGTLCTLARNLDGSTKLYYTDPTFHEQPQQGKSFGSDTYAVLAHNRDRQPGTLNKCTTLNCEEFCVSSSGGGARCLCPYNPSQKCSALAVDFSTTHSTIKPIPQTPSDSASHSTATKSSTTSIKKEATQVTPDSGMSAIIIPATASVVVVGLVVVASIVAYTCIKKRNRSNSTPPTVMEPVYYSSEAPVYDYIEHTEYSPPSIYLNANPVDVEERGYEALSHSNNHAHALYSTLGSSKHKLLSRPSPVEQQ